MKAKTAYRKPIIMIVGVIICLVMLRLGVWQLDRADQKRALQQQTLKLSAQPPVTLNQVLKNKQKLTRFKQIATHGKYVEEATILIDNKLLNGSVGYHVLTPLIIEGMDSLLIVNRGWISAKNNRSTLPSFNTPKQTIEITGRLNNFPAKPMLWKDEYQIKNGHVWQFLDIEQYTSQTSLKFLPKLLELAPNIDGVGGFERQWLEISDKGIGKHQAYAFQWFSMAAAFLIACLILLTRDLNKKQRS